MRKQFIAYSFLVVVGFLTQACKVVVPDQVTTGGGTGNSQSQNLLTCSAVISGVSSATSGTPVPILVNASGGTAPYSLPGISGTFASFTTTTRTYSNTTSSDIIVDDQVTILDSASNAATCGFKVTVKSSSNPTNVSCSLVANPNPAVVNTNVVLSATASGGTAPYTFGSLVVGTDGSIVNTLSSSSSTQATATVKWSSSGLKTPSVVAQDANGNLATCSVSETVNPAASVSLVASPSASVAANQVITLSAVPANFAPTSYTFSTSDTNVRLTMGSQVGTSVTGTSAVIAVSSLDGLNHNFTVNVTATQGSQSASQSISLAFTSVALSCALTHPSGTYVAGATVPFTISASNLAANESLIVDTFSVNSGTILTIPLATTVNVKFDQAGSKFISATAHTSQGRVCNAGQAVQDTLTINSAFSCSAYTTPSYSYVGQYINAGATITGGVGQSVVTRIDTYSWVYLTGYFTSNTNAYLAFWDYGVFPVQVTVRDSAGNTTTCSTTQVVTY